MPNQFTAALWGDEGFSAILSMKSLPEIIKTIINDTSPPLWNVTEWIVFNTLGTQEIYIRLLAFSYFVLTAFFVYKIADFLWNRKTGILAAALTFLNPFFFIYAFEGRMYSILALGVTASMYYFLKIIRGSTARLDKVGYVFFALWAMYSHHFAIFALFLQGMWFLYLLVKGERREVKVLFRMFTFVAIGYLPWMYPLYNQAKMVGGGFWLGTPNTSDLRHLFKEYLGAGIEHGLSTVAFYLVLLGFVFRGWLKDIRKSAFFILWFVGPILVTWIVSQKFQSIFFNRYLLYAIPGAMLLLASQKRKISGIIIAGILIVFAVIDWNYFTHPTKLPWRELAGYVKKTKTQNDFLINWNGSAHHLWETKYYGIPAPIYIPEGGELPFFVGTALMQEGDIINTIPERVKRVGVVTSGSFEEIDVKGYTENDRREFGKLRFVWYEKNI